MAFFGQGHGEIKASSRLKALTILADISVVLIPAALVGFIIFVWRLDDKVYVEGALDPWQNAIIVLATAFPILFASIVGRLMAAAARWKLERGAEIGLLESLMGSRTVGSTVVTLAQMGRLNLGVLGLLALWCISPLGGQAFLRILSVEPRIESDPAVVSYFDTNAAAKVNYQFFTDDSSQTHQSLMTTIYRALIIGSGPSKVAPMDLWGNVKIPFLQDAGEGNDNGWVAVRKNDADGTSGIPYASLLGVPLGLPQSSSFASGNVSFLLESSYVDLQCSNLDIFTTVPTYELESFDEPELRLHNITNGTWWVPCLPNRTVTTVPKCQDENALWAVALDRFADRLWTPAYERSLFSPSLLTDESGIEVGRTRLLFMSYHLAFKSDGTLGPERATAECDVVQKYVTSRVNCTRTGQSEETNAVGSADCRAVAQRPSKEKHPSADISFLSFQDVFSMVAKLMPSIGRHTHSYSDVSAGYLSDPSRLIQPEEVVSMANATGLELSRRLSQLLNTFIGTTQLVLNATIGSMPTEP